jgi:hypothetical protein
MRGIDLRHIVPKTIHVREDGSGLQVVLKRKRKQKGGKIYNSFKDSLYPTLRELAPDIVRSIFKLARTRDTAQFKKDIIDIGIDGVKSVGQRTFQNEVRNMF